MPNLQPDISDPLLKPTVRVQSPLAVGHIAGSQTFRQRETRHFGSFSPQRLREPLPCLKAPTGPHNQFHKATARIGLPDDEEPPVQIVKRPIGQHPHSFKNPHGQRPLQQASRHPDDVARTAFPQPERLAAVSGHPKGELHLVAVSPLGGGGQDRQHGRTRHLAHPLQRVVHDALFPCELAAIGQRLPRTSTAPSGMGARRLLLVRRTLEHFNKCGFRKALPHGGDPRTHELPRQGILDKYDHAVMTPEAAPVGHQRIHAQFEELAGNKGIYKWFGHASSEAPA